MNGALIANDDSVLMCNGWLLSYYYSCNRSGTIIAHLLTYWHLFVLSTTVDPASLRGTTNDIVLSCSFSSSIRAWMRLSFARTIFPTLVDYLSLILVNCPPFLGREGVGRSQGCDQSWRFISFRFSELSPCFKCETTIFHGVSTCRFPTCNSCEPS